jgi:large subunit ribosomal protein L34e
LSRPFLFIQFDSFKSFVQTPSSSIHPPLIHPVSNNAISCFSKESHTTTSHLIQIIIHIISQYPSSEQNPNNLQKMQRLTYRRRLSYNTKSNKVRAVKAPGGVVKLQYVKKRGTTVKCGDCQDSLAGVPALRPKGYMRLSKNKKNVTRAYGGSRCGSCVRNRIVRAFLIEEQKIVKKVLKTAAADAKKTVKTAKK